MSKLMITAFVVAGIMALSGCMSLEERLASSDPRVKNEAEHELIQISRATGTESDRIAAINRISNRDFLYEMAMKATTNQWVAEDASFDPSGYDGYQTAGNTRVYYKVTSYGPTYKRMNGKSLDTTKDGVAAFERLSLDITKTEDYKKLFELIRKAESPYVRLAVLKSVKDPKWSQTMAKELARATSDPAVQAEAFARIEPPEARFAAMAQCSVDAKTRKEAFAKLTDQKIIDDVILKTTDKALLMGGMSKVSDKAALASRVFAKEFAGKNDAVDKELVLGWLKLMGGGLKGAREKLLENGVDLDMILACLYRDRANELSDEDRRLLISGITNQEIVTRMISPPTQEELRKRDELKELDDQISRNKKMVMIYRRPQDKDKRNECIASIAECKEKRDKLAQSIKPSLFVTNDGARAVLYGKVDPEILKPIAFNAIHKHTLDSWNNSRNDELETAVLIANNVSDKKIGGRIAVALIFKLNAYRSRCQSGWGLSWSNKDKSMADKFTKSVEGLLTDDLLEEIVNEDDSKLVSLAHLFKDKKRSSKLGFTRIQNAVKNGKENVITKAWKDYGAAVTDDEMLKTLSVSSIYLRRPAFDQIKDDEVKADTLAAIKESLAAELKACAAKQGELANFIGEIGNGDDLIAWLKGKSGQTNLQNKETFAKQKGRIVVLRGEVKNIGQTMFSSKTYVSLRVAKVGMFDYIDVQFNVPDSLKPTVTAWMKGESHIMRGKLTSQGDLEDDAKCDDGEIVSEEKFNEAVNLKEAMEDIKWQLKEIDEKKVPPVRTRPSRFGNAVKSAAGWIKDGVDDIKSSGDDLKQAAEMLNGLFN